MTGISGITNMRRLLWSDFRRDYPAAHLVVALLEPDDSQVPQGVRSRIDMLSRLIRTTRPSGVYSMAVMRDGGGTEIHCGFVATGDAQKFSDLVGAYAIQRYAGWLTQRAFTVTGAIEDAAGPAGVRERRTRQA